ncbi:Pyrimidine-nucleoside phosphorylase [compost metagenome]
MIHHIINKTKTKTVLTPEEIAYLVHNYTQGEILDSQMSAWAMAVLINGLTVEETAQLTYEMARSGDQLNLDHIPGIKVDKHSTGGVGDKTTMVLAPLVAAAGVPIAKMSGRGGFGFGAGTIDKLESIPGFKVERTGEEFTAQLLEHRVALMSQSKRMTPADNLLYTLRGLTSTFDSIPLVASSVMSKKIAAGADAILLDVKTGDGAICKSHEDAVILAEMMVGIGRELGRKVIALVTNMDQPLGTMAGNAVEVKEAIETLQGKGPKDLEELCLTMASYMIVMGGRETDLGEAKKQLRELLHNGKAFLKMRDLVEAQGGDVSVIDDPDKLLTANGRIKAYATKSGYIQDIETPAIGYAVNDLGAGRKRGTDPIDHGIGAKLHKKVGDYVREGELLADIYAHQSENEEISRRVSGAFTIGETVPPAFPLILTVVDEHGARGFESF